MRNTKIIKWLPVAIIIALGVYLRLRNNFSTVLMPGINGGYYPFQIKNLLVGNGLGFKDMPLVFILEAFLAKILGVLSSQNLNETILNSSKIVDAVIPPLVAIPLFLFAAKISKEAENRKMFHFYVLVAFSVLYLSFVAIQGSDFQKNAVGLVWVSLFLYSFFSYQKSNSRNDLILLIASFILTLLTHVGCFGALMCFLAIYGMFYFLRNFRRIKLNKRFVYVAIAVTVTSLVTLFAIDKVRFLRLGTFIISPLTFFENPIILFMLNKQPIIQGIWLINFLACNILAISGFIYLLIRKNRIEKEYRPFVLSIATVALFLTSPLLGIEWAERFLWIAPVFIVIAYMFIFSIMSKKVFKVMLSIFLILLIVYSFRPTMMGKRPHISEESYQELFMIKKSTELGNNSIILTRHGLEWWAGFVLGVKVGQDYSLTKNEFKNYDNIYVLKQKQGNNFTMLAWSHFLEVETPGTAILQYEGEYFDLFKITDPLDYSEETSRPPETYGVIRKIQGNELFISNERYAYKVHIDPETEISFKTNNKKLQEGMNIELWGKRKPFSLQIVAETIHQIDGKKI